MGLNLSTTVGLQIVWNRSNSSASDAEIILISFHVFLTKQTKDWKKT